MLKRPEIAGPLIGLFTLVPIFVPVRYVYFVLEDLYVKLDLKPELGGRL